MTWQENNRIIAGIKKGTLCKFLTLKELKGKSCLISFNDTEMAHLCGKEFRFKEAYNRSGVYCMRSEENIEKGIASLNGIGFWLVTADMFAITPILNED